MLTANQQAEFDFAGMLKVKSLISDPAISRARDSVLSRFEALGFCRDGQWQLADRPRPKWPDKGYSAKAVGNKIENVERLLDQPGVKPIVDAILDHADLDREFFKRPQILVTFPNAGDWFMPHDGWHVDIPRLASGRRPGVQVFILLEEIKLQGGGTLVVKGSHRLLNNGTFVRSRDVTKLLRQEPFFHRLMSAPNSCTDGLEVLEGSKKSMEQIDLDVVELTGSPGDVYFVDMRAIHSAAPNMSELPRMMATHRFLRADVASEIKASS